MKKFLTKAMAMGLAMLILSGCYGPFKLTKKVFDWNGSLPSPWGREAVFLVLSVLPVYGLSLVADAVFFNVFDFWGGTNPIARNESRTRLVQLGDDRQAVLSYSGERQRMRVDIFRQHRPDCCFVIEAGQGRTLAKDAQGRLLMTAKTLEDGSVFIQDAQGKEVACHLPEEAQ